MFMAREKKQNNKEQKANKTTSNRKTFIIILLIVLCLSIGYAALTTRLDIIGDVFIKHKEQQGRFDVHWENLQPVTGSSLEVTPASISSNQLEVDYSILFNTPGQVYEFTVDAVNKGDYDAISTDSTKSPLTTSQQKYLIYTVLEEGETPTAGKTLAKNASRTYKVRVEFNKDIDADILDEASNSEIDLSFIIPYVQK